LSAINGDGGVPAEMFPGIANPVGTGAPGSVGDTASETAGGLVASPVVSIPGFSSQLAEGRPTLDVMAGDTSAMSSDMPVGDHFASLTGVDQGAMLSTGAGAGQTTTRHPNSGR